MQAGGEIDDPDRAIEIWLNARDAAVEAAEALAKLGVHKSIVNRLTEPWMWITVVMSATEWDNFFRLRCHPDAEIHFQKLAWMIREMLEASTPQQKYRDEIHAPFIQDDEWGSFDRDQICKISTARCARVSYMTHDGVRDLAKDLELFDRLCQGSGFGHWSPHEHVAFASESPVRSGPFIGWRQFRKKFPNECA